MPRRYESMTVHEAVNRGVIFFAAGGSDFGIMLLLLEVWAVSLWQFVSVGEMTRGA